MNLRERRRIDYKIYHSTGRKVALVGGDMDSKAAILEERKIAGDISHTCGIYVLEDLISEPEVNEATSVVSRLYSSYRHIHVELTSLLSEDEYREKYSTYGTNCVKVDNYLRDAKLKIRNLQSQYQEDDQKAKMCQFDIDFKVLNEKVSYVNDNVDIHVVKERGIDRYITKMETFVDEFFNLSAPLRFTNPTEFEKVYETEFKDSIFEIQQDIKLSRQLKQKIQEFRDDSERIRSSQKRQAKSLTSADNLRIEIEYRFKSLSQKFGVDLDELGDYQILDIRNDRTVETEFNSILERMSEFATFIPPGGEKVEKMYKKLCKARDRLAKKKSDFFEKLQEILLKHDITADKLKHAAELTIDLPKFSGYDSKLDFYTFKSEFKKLFEPKISKKSHADYLKRKCLSGQALLMVENETDCEKIWERLQNSFGNARVLLQNKLSSLDKFNLSNVKGDQKIASGLSSLTNLMDDLSSLAAQHNIEGQLYEGGGLEKVMFLGGDNRHRKFRSQNITANLSKKQEWQKLNEFLKQELLWREKMAIDQKAAELMGLSSSKPGSSNFGKSAFTTGQSGKCHICEKDGHFQITTSRGNKIIPYYVCEVFVKMSCIERLSKLESKNLCTKCLYPGAIKGPKHRCFYANFLCPSHEKKDRIHVLLCELHKGNAKNLELLEKFKEKFIKNCTVTLPPISSTLSFVSITFAGSSDLKALPGTETTFGEFKSLPDIVESSIFQFQTILICGIKLNIFFDNGCGDMIIKKSAAEKLVSMGRAIKIFSDPIQLSGVADQKTTVTDGAYSICLPLCTGQNATLSGICLPKITCDFPEYELTDVVHDIHQKCREVGGEPLVSQLPKFAKTAGGDTDILLGKKYFAYFPELIKKFGNGLAVFRSVFYGVKKSRGVLCGPHDGFAKFENGTENVAKFAYLTPKASVYQSMWSLGLDVPLLTEKAKLSMDDLDRPICCEHARPDHDFETEASDGGNGSDVGAHVSVIASDDQACPEIHSETEVSHQTTFCGNNVSCVAKGGPRKVRFADELDKAGTEVTYRCPDCRGCQKCKNGPRIENISIENEQQHRLIEQCVQVDIEHAITIARLPFLADPDSRLAPNESIAQKVFRSQLIKLNAKPEDKKSVLESENKLQEMGYVEYVDNLDPDVRDSIVNAEVKYFIPWRPVWSGSVTTPCRLCFDASMSGRDGCSLNSLLAKGANSLNNLMGITLRWTTHHHAYHTDVQKMYNRVMLSQEHWRYQLYLFSQNLDLKDTPLWKVIKTLIYGVRPSGALAEHALRRTVELCKEQYPLAYDPIMNDTYMDDVASGTEGLEQTLLVTDQINLAVGTGGFSMKGFTFSGSDPPEHLSKDGKSITVLGLRYFPKGDFFKLNFGDMNFARKERGKKPQAKVGTIPEMLTLTDCVSRRSEVYDPLGRVAPILAGIKLDESILHQRCLRWDDPIPDELKSVWVANFGLIDELRTLEFSRAVIPSDAINLDMETINIADAGEHLVCSAVYVRFLRKDGSHSCQLMFSRTKIVHDVTIPRAELVAALLNSSTAHVVRSSLGDRVKQSWYFTDSQVALFWINCTKAALKPYVRNRVVEIVHLTESFRWFYITSENNIADLGTRKGATISQIDSKSDWNLGMPWMRGEESDFPTATCEELILSAKEKADMNKEKVIPECLEAHTTECRCFHSRRVPDEVEKRYEFSNYLISPNRYRFRTVTRVLGLVFLFIKKISAKLKRKFHFLDVPEYQQISKDQYTVFEVLAATSDTVTRVAVVQLEDEMLQAARNYYFRKAALEIQEFVEPHRYAKQSVFKNEMLYFTGRILRTQKIDDRIGLGDAMLDLSEATFCVPMTDCRSPIAYAVVLDTHWYDSDVRHKGVETTLRYAQKTAYIIGGRDLVKGITKDCTRCRILHKKGVEVAMGPVADENLMIAPAFYVSQVDLCGPFKAYSPANKRATLKVWLAVFCCTVTSAVDCRAMEDYSTDQFVSAYARLSSGRGYPKKLMPDEGSQLVKACEDMTLSFTDISHRLHTEFGVEFKTCPVGAHYVHGKVERKIQQIKESISVSVHKERLSILQWETLAQQLSNSINNLPIGLRNKSECLENLDLLTPNRLMLGFNNDRSPTVPLVLAEDYKSIVAQNSGIVKSWFKEWLVSYVPQLVDQPKWFLTERSICVGDVVLFLKADSEIQKLYQYGIVRNTFESRDGLIREVLVEYQNHSENVKRTTKRCVRDIVVIHPVEELGISKELHALSESTKIN